MAVHLSKNLTSNIFKCMNFPSGMLNETFILNKVKIDAADTSRPKLKITVTKNTFFEHSST